MNINIKYTTMILFAGTLMMFLLGGCSDTTPTGEAPPVTEPVAPLPPVEGTVALYPAPTGLPENVKGRDHAFMVNDQSCFVYRTEATGSKEYGSVYPEYAYFDLSGSALLTVAPNYTVNTVEILPSRAGITPQVKDNKISFVVTKPGQYFVKINGNPANGSTASKNFYVFANPPETNAPSPTDDNVVYFAPGVHAHKEYKLESDKTYYIAGGAFVYGRFYGSKLKNVTIRGRGIICGEQLTDMGDAGRIICINNASDNIRIEGINAMHPKVWTVAMYQSNNIHIDNIHVIAHGMSSDGCDITGCHDVLVENSFFRGHDDILAVKARDFINEMAIPQTCENVTFKNNVIWSDSSNPMTIGYETNQDIKNILYEGIDVLNMSRPDVWQLEAVMAIEPHDQGNIDGVTYKDIRVDVQIPQNSLFRFSVDGGTGNIKNITLDNIWVNYGGTLGGLIYGTTTADIDGIRFNNVRNNEGLVLSADKVTTNTYVKGIVLSPQKGKGASVNEEWDFSTEFSGFGNVQGRFNWYYKYLDETGTKKDLTFNGSRWSTGSYCYILWDRTDTNPYRNFPQMAAHMHPEDKKQPALVWKAPASGKILITGKARRLGASGDGVTISIRKNSSIPFCSKDIDRTNHAFIDAGSYEQTVKAGDEICFSVGMKGNNDSDNTEWIPVIKYLSVD